MTTVIDHIAELHVANSKLNMELGDAEMKISDMELKIAQLTQMLQAERKEATRIQAELSQVLCENRELHRDMEYVREHSPDWDDEQRCWLFDIEEF